MNKHLFEEINRRVADVIDDVNLGYMKRAKKCFYECSLFKERLCVTSALMPEIMHTDL